MADRYPDLGHEIEKTGELSDTTAETLKKALDEFKKGFGV